MKNAKEKKKQSKEKKYDVQVDMFLEKKNIKKKLLVK